MSLFDGYVVTQEIKNMLKIYPDFVRLYEYSSPHYVRRFDYGERRPYNPNKKQWPKPDPEDYERSSLARARIKVIDLALANPWDVFLTFTFAKDRHDVDAKKRQLAFWLNNQRNLHGNFAYLLVPEFHKDGAIHFHGLFHNYNGTLVDSGKQQHGRTIFNISSYRGGFTTAVKIDDIVKVAGYISKYITKAMPRFKNKQRYWCSNGLKRPIKIINPNLTADDKQLFSSIHKNQFQEIFEVRGQLSKADIDRISNYSKVREDTLLVTEL